METQTKNRVLITGGAGFIGHHLVEHILKNTNWEIVILDRLDISGCLERLRDLDIWEKEKSRVKFIWWDLKAGLNGFVAGDIGEVDYILHLAASTHVDRSISDPISFVMDNVVGTANILEFARKQSSLKSFLYFSTDEVFGPAPAGVAYKENDRYNSGNPYAASKAGGEELALSYSNTYGLPVIITHTMNVFGERQHPEKFIPLVIQKVLDGRNVLIHANKNCTKSGSRYWIHARNVAGAIFFLLKRANPCCGQKFNIVGEREVDNLEMAQFIAKVLGKPLNYEMVDFHSSRPGHDLRYALDGSKMAVLGWKLPFSFEESLTKTIKWTVDHPQWLK
jgi:dTDP-glucose 4,6-dehydratase